MFRIVLLFMLLSSLLGCEQSQTDSQIVDCQDLVKGCDIGLGQITFSQNPKQLAPFSITFSTWQSSGQLSAVNAQFMMQGMQMGFNRYRFIQEKNNTWQANVILPVCMQGRADWLMQLEITENGQTKKGVIPFKST